MKKNRNLFKTFLVWLQILFCSLPLIQIGVYALDFEFGRKEWSTIYSGTDFGFINDNGLQPQEDEIESYLLFEKRLNSLDFACASYLVNNLGFTCTDEAFMNDVTFTFSQFYNFLYDNTLSYPFDFQFDDLVNGISFSDYDNYFVGFNGTIYPRFIFMKLNFTNVIGDFNHDSWLFNAENGSYIFAVAKNIFLDFYLNYLLSVAILCLLFDFIMYFIMFIRKMLDKFLEFERSF